MEAEPLPENVEDLIEALLAHCIAVFEREGEAGVQKICQENPGVADELRARLSWLLDRKMIAAPDCPATTGLSGVFAKLGGDRAIGMHLEPEGSDGPPVKVTEEVRRLRDPSGRYQFLGEIGRGGIGVVYKGRDTDLGRDVAMKMLRDEYAGNADALSRFVEEAQIGGQLQHPGIVPVYDVGLQAGERPYFAMKLIKGKTLAAQLAERGDPSADRRLLLGVFEQVCQTMAYAHARRVVHRDLKPANVMIGAFGEVQVVDWGLAKVLQKDLGPDERERLASTASVILTVRSREGSESAAGSVLGTPAYMPPEQALGEIDLLDQRSDVFGLGAILCEILTGEAPYREQDGDVLQQAATAALRPAKERLAACGADRALVELCAECLAPEREERPASAQELAGRVSAYLTSVEERARQAELRAAEARYRQRTTLVAAAAAILILALCAGAWIWLEDAAKARRVDATQRVALAMNEASGLRGQAVAAKLDLGLWAQAMTSAEAASRMAGAADVDDGTRANAATLLAAVERERREAESEAARQARDRRMLERLQTLRIPTDDDVRRGGWARAEHRRLDRAYGEVFAEYVGDAAFLEKRADSVLESLRAGGIGTELAIALDHWALVRDQLARMLRQESKDAEVPDASRTAALRQLALLLDPGDAWRSRLRFLLPDAATERARLTELSENVDFAALPPGAIPLLGEALWVAGALERAIDVLRLGQELHPRDFGLCFQLAVSLELLAEPRWEESVAILRIAHALNPGMNEVLHRQGMALDKVGRHEDAVRVFQRLVDREPSNEHWFYHLGNSRYHWGRFDEAIADLRRAIDLDADHARTHNSLGVVLMDQGKLVDAIASFERSLQMEPDAGTYTNLGCALQAQGKLDEAVACHERALKIEPKHVAAHNNLGNTLRAQGKLDEAIASIDRALQIAPNLAEPHFCLGATLQAKGKLEEAIASYERALKIDPKKAGVHSNLGSALHAQGKLEEAVASYERALKIDPKKAGVHNNLGNTLRAQGKLDEAIASFERALRIAPDLAEAHFSLAVTLHTQGKLEEAVASYQRAQEIFGKRSGAFAGRWRHIASERIAELQASIDNRATPEEVLSRLRSARSPEEWAAAIQPAYDTRRFREIIEITEATLRDAAELTNGDGWGLYNSACAAALHAADAASGLDQDERARIRTLARSWLEREVERWATAIRNASETATEARASLTHALRDADFASVRADALLRLAPAERTAWHTLWTSIEETLKQAPR